MKSSIRSFSPIHQPKMASLPKSSAQSNIPASSIAAAQGDNIAHALAGAGGGLLSTTLTYVLPHEVSIRRVTQLLNISHQLSSHHFIHSRAGRVEKGTNLDLRCCPTYHSERGNRRSLLRSRFGPCWYQCDEFRLLLLYVFLSSLPFVGFSHQYLSSFFGSGYEWTRALFTRAALRTGRASKKLTTVESMIAGALAGSITVLITNPIWVINTRMTARSTESSSSLPSPSTTQKTRKPSTISTLLALFREEGPAALFAGVLPALVLVINPILQYTIFEQLKDALEKRRGRVLPRDIFVLGAIGKLMATVITYPYITIKSRMHVAKKEGPQDDIIGSLKRVVREEGWGGLYKGIFLQFSLGQVKSHLVLTPSSTLGIGPKASQSVITAAFLFAFKDALYDASVQVRRKIPSTLPLK